MTSRRHENFEQEHGDNYQETIRWDFLSNGNG